jgi:hypothetical protein
VPDTAVAVSCTLDVQWIGFWGEQPSGVACGEPSFATMSLACPHEHLDKARICPGCAVDAQRAAGMLTCPHCWDGPERHACLMLVVIDWDSGEKTIVQEARRAG